jgi:hypothetical protein
MFSRTHAQAALYIVVEIANRYAGHDALQYMGQ